MLEVCGSGVLLTGPSGIGKSEAALGLLDRGHRLIADDSICIMSGPDGLRGICPPLLRGRLALRDLGVLEVARLFGAAAWAESCTLDFVIALEPAAAAVPAGELAPRLDHEQLLGHALPRLRLAAAAGRNLPLLIETATKDQQVRRQGHHADRRFQSEQRRALQRGTP